jgi:hypothetical protein
MGERMTDTILTGVLPRSIRKWALDTPGVEFVDATTMNEGRLVFPLSAISTVLANTRPSDLIAQLMKYIVRLRLHTAFYEALHILATNMHATPTTVVGS